MSTRLRTTWLAGSGAMLLVFAMVGAVAGASVLTSASGPAPESETDPVVVDTTATWEDLDGDGIDDDCETDEVVADPTAAASAEAAVDLDGDGTISVSEAAQSDRTGGTNCNHGGYVSGVANAECEPAEEPAPTETPEAAPTDELVPEATDDAEGDDDADCEAEDETDEEEAEEAACDAGTEDETEADEAVVFDPAVHGSLGAFVSQVAQSDVMGGKNCNHGGAVSEAVKAAKEAAREAREAARAERAAERAAAKAARDAAKAERTGNAKAHGKGKGKDQD